MKNRNCSFRKKPESEPEKSAENRRMPILICCRYLVPRARIGHKIGDAPILYCGAYQKWETGIPENSGFFPEKADPSQLPGEPMELFVPFGFVDWKSAIRSRSCRDAT